MSHQVLGICHPFSDFLLHFLHEIKWQIGHATILQCRYTKKLLIFNKNNLLNVHWAYFLGVFRCTKDYAEKMAE